MPRYELRIAREEVTRLVDWARQARPWEACGLLLGRGPTASAPGRVHRVVRARNLLAGVVRDRFELDPGAVVAATREAEAAGQELVGVWHSHPDRPARPSARDRAGAWSDHSQLIVSVAAGRPAAARSYRLRRGRFVEEELRIRTLPGPWRTPAP